MGDPHAASSSEDTLVDLGLSLPVPLCPALTSLLCSLSSNCGLGGPAGCSLQCQWGPRAPECTLRGVVFAPGQATSLWPCLPPLSPCAAAMVREAPGLRACWAGAAGGSLGLSLGNALTFWEPSASMCIYTYLCLPVHLSLLPLPSTNRAAD